MAEVVYVLCALTSLACLVLLLRGYLQRRTRLLLWSALCFGWLTLNNLLLFADRVLFPDVALGMWRAVTALLGVSFLLYGLIWESK